MASDEGPPGAEPAAPTPGGQVRRLRLLGVPSPVARGREFARRALDDWHAQDHDDILLLVSELLSNAVLHAGGARDLVLYAVPERLRIEVTDASPNLPRPREPRGAGVPGGHGLHIVEKLADRWGTVSREDGKSVWLEIVTPLATP
ncbi:ATP-binding protein [Kitasatospora sp. CMC57]|uniref:ATP-binding protein n=1 Tax=Kitasatospora sp. CMC57 TaxID=3231513 RepID=A0AB33K6T5_9ACTN